MKVNRVGSLEARIKALEEAKRTHDLTSYCELSGINPEKIRHLSVENVIEEELCALQQRQNLRRINRSGGM